jgi:hypothetical protein
VGDAVYRQGVKRGANRRRVGPVRREERLPHGTGDLFGVAVDGIA